MSPLSLMHCHNAHAVSVRRQARATGAFLGVKSQRQLAKRGGRPPSSHRRRWSALARRTASIQCSGRLSTRRCNRPHQCQPVLPSARQVEAAVSHTTSSSSSLADTVQGLSIPLCLSDCTWVHMYVCVYARDCLCVRLGRGWWVCVCARAVVPAHILLAYYFRSICEKITYLPSVLESVTADAVCIAGWHPGEEWPPTAAVSGTGGVCQRVISMSASIWACCWWWWWW